MKTTFFYIGTSLAMLIIFVGGYFLFVALTSPRLPEFSLTSSAFENGGPIPAKYTCDGANTSPPLTIANVPEGTRSMVLLMTDPDVPTELVPTGVFDHWILFAISPDTTEIPENSSAGATGLNGAGEAIYIGPCPPTDYEPTEHRYFFRLFALYGAPAFDSPPTKEELLVALEEGNVIDTAELFGTYERSGR